MKMPGIVLKEKDNSKLVCTVICAFVVLMLAVLAYKNRVLVCKYIIHPKKDIDCPECDVFEDAAAETN